MMNNLFSTFDPSTSMNMSLNWTSTCMFILIMPMPIWITQSRKTNTFNNIMKIMYSELSNLLIKKNSSMYIMLMSMFFFIMMNNTMGLIPYMFTSSAHMLFSASLSLPLWVMLMLIAWIKHTQQMFMHLVPESTPKILMPFMVCIETISNIIRPGSLAVRLTANMIAGHMIMSLLGNSSIHIMNKILPLIVIIQITLMLFEMAVAMIQTYVFTILSTLYTKEITYEIK